MCQSFRKRACLIFGTRTIGGRGGRPGGENTKARNIRKVQPCPTTLTLRRAAAAAVASDVAAAPFGGGMRGGRQHRRRAAVAARRRRRPGRRLTAPLWQPGAVAAGADAPAPNGATPWGASTELLHECRAGSRAATVSVAAGSNGDSASRRGSRGGGSPIPPLTQGGAPTARLHGNAHTPAAPHPTPAPALRPHQRQPPCLESRPP